MSRTNAHGRPAQVDSPWMLKKISFMSSRCSVIAGNLPARGSLRLFEDQAERDPTRARDALAIVILGRRGQRIIAGARNLHPHAAPSRFDFANFAPSLRRATG